MKTKFAVGDIVRVSWDVKVIYGRIIGHDQKNGFFLVEPVTDSGKVQPRWVRMAWILEG